MSDMTRRRYRTARRWPTVLLMAAVSVGVVLLAGWAYPALRAEYLTPPTETAVTVDGATPIPVTPATLTSFGAQAVFRTPEGYVAVETTVRGYKSDIRVRSVFSPDGQTLVSLRVLAQNETEYLGERVQTAAFAAQFAGRRGPFKLWQAATVGSPIDALSGATVSSQAVVDAVNNAYALLEEIQ